MTSIDEVNSKADELHELARTLDDESALKMYRQVLELDPNRPTTYYNIGLIFKYQANWPESFHYNKKAVELNPDDESANWNLAIAATALRDWRAARETWSRLGINIESGDGPIDCDFGMTPVRLNPEEKGEVVWGLRIDPVRVRIENIPYATSGFRHGDIVLHDGAAVGHRSIDGREYPVFNVLELFEPSRQSTYEVEVLAPSAGDVEELIAAFAEFCIEAEDWTTNVRQICRQCSEGTPHEDHDEEGPQEWLDRRFLGVGATGRS